MSTADSTIFFGGQERQRTQKIAAPSLGFEEWWPHDRQSARAKFQLVPMPPWPPCPPLWQPCLSALRPDCPRSLSCLTCSAAARRARVAERARYAWPSDWRRRLRAAGFDPLLSRLRATYPPAGALTHAASNTTALSNSLPLMSLPRYLSCAPFGSHALAEHPLPRHRRRRRCRRGRRRRRLADLTCDRTRPAVRGGSCGPGAAPSGKRPSKRFPLALLRTAESPGSRR